MRIIVFGANGPTDRQLVDQALNAGHKVAAVTRRTDSVAQRDGRTVVGADVIDAVDAAIAGSDAVLSALGVARSRKPIAVYSVGAMNAASGYRPADVRRTPRLRIRGQ